MIWHLRFLMPNRISGQIAIIIVASLLVIHIVLATAFFLTRPDRRMMSPPSQIVTLIELIDANAPEVRAKLVPNIARAFPRLQIALTDRATAEDQPGGSDSRVDEIRRLLGPGYRVMPVAGTGDSGTSADSGTSVVAVGLRDGQVVTLRMPGMRAHPFGPVTITLLFVAISVTFLGFWATRALTGPLRRFAKAAESFTPDEEIALLPDQGPFEIRAAAQALNRMQERIKGLVDERSRMLAAVSHDLRTPITRLRLRCEFIDDKCLRTRALDDLAHMNSMVESVLSFLRDGRSREKAVMLDLAIGLKTICDQFGDMGHDVTYHGPHRVVMRARHDELCRAFTNLVDNAVRHGGKTDVSLTATPSAIVVSIEDDGPGIIEHSKEDIFKPFVRGDVARNMNSKNGYGLGLSIARLVIEAHGGKLELLDRQPSGLVAKVELPQSIDSGGKASDVSASPVEVS
jgi:signal transduction histidine kinase